MATNPSFHIHPPSNQHLNSQLAWATILYFSFLKTSAPSATSPLFADHLPFTFLQLFSILKQSEEVSPTLSPPQLLTFPVCPTHSTLNSISRLPGDVCQQIYLLHHSHHSCSCFYYIILISKQMYFFLRIKK